MKTSISRESFDVLIGQTGLPLDAMQKHTLYDAYFMVEDMIARVSAPLPREAEPALLFVPDVR